MTENPFEIPQALRDVSEQNLKQAHAAYEQLTDFVTKAINAWMGAIPASPMVTGFREVQDRAVNLAKENAESAFAFADKINNAKSYQEMLTLQTQFAQERMLAFVAQTQHLYGLIGKALQKSARG